MLEKLPPGSEFGVGAQRHGTLPGGSPMIIPSRAERQKQAIAFGQRFLHDNLMMQGKPLGHGGLVQPGINHKRTPAIFGLVRQALQGTRQRVAE